MLENALLQHLLQRQTRSPDVAIGIGDDGAVLNRPQGDLVFTTDLIADGSHFLSQQATPEQIGRKAMAVNLSDLAAMAAEPLAAFVSLLLPSSVSNPYAERLMAGIQEVGEQFRCPVIGGDTNVWPKDHKGKLAINVLVVGQTTSQGPLLRSGAKPGDQLLVTGELGGSLISGRHLDFTPRVEEALLLHRQFDIHAAMDLSDGLAMDLRRLCVASECGALVQTSSLPISRSVQQQTSVRSEQVLHALGDGEDFELLLAVPEDEAQRILATQPLDVPVTLIGQCIEGQDVLQSDDGKQTPLPTVGYQHGEANEE